MNYRNTLGCIEVVINEQENLNCFYKVANFLTDTFKVKFTLKSDEPDAINWEFKYSGHRLNLHYDIYNGTSFFPQSTTRANDKENNAVKKLATKLSEYFPFDSQNLVA